MLGIIDLRARTVRLLGLAAVAMLMLSVGAARRAEALTLINPSTSPAAKAASDDLITQVRHGGGGGHIGGFHGGGGFHAAHIGGFHGARVHGIRYGGYHYAGHPHFYGHHHFHRRFYYGGYYPYYSYPRRCRIVWTYWGPRRVCHWHHWWPYRYYW